jgi:hypothetical protein
VQDVEVIQPAGCLSFGSKKKEGQLSIVPTKKNAVMALSEDYLSRDSLTESRVNNPLTADAVIWIGDLNYRINGAVGAIVTAIKRNMYEVLQDNDQLSIERKIGRLPDHLQEGPILFAPTYKLKQGTDIYKVPARIPSWTDRVLFASRSDYLSQKSYDSNNLLKQSDHRPVFS